MIRIIRERHGRYIETWETRGRWMERPNGDTFWFVDAYIRCLKVEAA